LLDPRFKNKLFSDAENVKFMTKKLLEEVVACEKGKKETIKPHQYVQIMRKRILPQKSRRYIYFLVLKFYSMLKMK